MIIFDTFLRNTFFELVIRKMIQSRRSVIKPIGSAITLSGGAGVAVGQSNRKRRNRSTGKNGSSTKKNGIIKRIAAWLRDGEIQKAKSMADTHGIDMDIMENDFQISTEDSAGPSIQSAMEGPTSGDLTFSHLRSIDSKRDYFTLRWSIGRSDSNVIDAPKPVDIAGIAWEDSQWGLTSLDDVAFSATGTRDGSSVNPEVKQKGGGLFGESHNAIVLEVNDFLWDSNSPTGLMLDELSGSLQVKLRRQGYPDRQPGRVEAMYEHTWSPLGTASANIRSVSIDMGAGGISVDLPFGADSRSEYEDISK